MMHMAVNMGVLSGEVNGILQTFDKLLFKKIETGG